MKIAFYKSKKNIFNRLISFWTRGPYSHVEALIEGDLATEVYCASSSFMDGGVRFKTIVLDPNHWDVVDVPSIDTVKVRAWYNDHLGAKYDLLGVFGVITPIHNNKNKFFCSESIATSAGWSDGWRWHPNHLSRIVQLVGCTQIPLDGTSVLV